MCGRSSLHDAPRNVLERFHLPPVSDFKPRYNICPTQEQLTLGLSRDGNAYVAWRRWGLIPEWATDTSIGNRMINARAESLADRPAFSTPLRFRRCLIVVDGYFEWMKNGKKKTPLFFHHADNRAFGMAGLWDRCERVSPAIESCTVVTNAATSRMAQYHERMPALLSMEAADEWLDPRTPVNRCLDILASCGDEEIDCHEVSTFVNSPANDSPECIARIQS